MPTNNTTSLVWVSEYRRYLTEAEAMNNAQLVAYHFYGRWTAEAVSALCGNMWAESTLNPDMYEYGFSWEEDRGYGLVQWTPRSKYWNWATANNLDPRHGDSQLKRIDYEMENGIQWIATTDYPISFETFATETGYDVDYLTQAFTWNYERPNRQAGEDSMPKRLAFARRCLTELDWTGYEPPKQGNGDIDLAMFIMNNRRRIPRRRR